MRSISGEWSTAADADEDALRQSVETEVSSIVDNSG